jgi:threonine/homoserine/homoserine lactone efflux protein
MTKGVTAGWRASAATALGSLSAITIIMTLSFTGLGVVIASSELVFNLIKWAGAAYLIYLGVSCLMSKQESYVRPDGQASSGSKSHFIGGFVVGASNPKAIVFFTALFPQFIAAGALLSSTSRS